MALHDVITICAAREDERNINGTFLLKEKSWMMLTALCLRVARENRNEQGSICLLPRHTASAWVVFLIQKVGHKILCEVKDRSGLTAFFMLAE